LGGGAVSQASSSAYFDYMRGLMEERAGNMVKALEAYEQVVRQDPQALEVYRDIAQLNLRMGRLEARCRPPRRRKIWRQRPGVVPFSGQCPGRPGKSRQSG